MKTKQEFTGTFKVFMIFLIIILVISLVSYEYSHFLIDTLGLPKLESIGEYDEFEVIFSAILYTLGFSSICILLIDIFRYIRHLFIKD